MNRLPCLPSGVMLALLAGLVVACGSGGTAAPAVDAPSSGDHYRRPMEHEPHAATWLQWPHDRTYPTQPQRYDATWVAMTLDLVQSETVKIIAYDSTEQVRITDLLRAAGVDLTQVEFYLAPTDDVWIRDNGPIFVEDGSGVLHVENWGFNGWGGRVPYANDDRIPGSVATWTRLPVVDLNSVVLEDGAIQHDGAGTGIATLTSVINPNRTRLTAEEMEVKLREYLGITRMIWLDGHLDPEDITDFHIDGFFMFLDSTRLVTMSDTDLAYWGVTDEDRATIAALTNAAGSPYARIDLPLTAANVTLASGRNLGFKGSYVNFYVANTVVLVPTYDDPNDAVALDILREQFPGRRVTGIDFREVFADGGMTHCVTQQEPTP